MQNEAKGQTIKFMSAKELLEESSPEMRAQPAPAVEAEGKTAGEMSRENSIEYQPAQETIPERVTHAEILETNRRHWA